MIDVALLTPSPRRLGVERGHRAAAVKRRLRPWKSISYFLVVLLPTLITLFYLGLVASDRYVTEFRFSVQSGSSPSLFNVNNSSGRSSSPTASAGGGTALFVADQMVVDYLQSRQVLVDLGKHIDAQGMYNRGGIDPVSRFWSDDGSIERFQKYWNFSVLSASFDATTGLATVSVMAFTPEESLRLSELLVRFSEKLVNEQSLRSRDDAVRFGKEGLAQAETRLKAALHIEEQFRSLHQSPNPATNANSTLALTATLEQRLAMMRAQMAALRKHLSTNAPTVIVLQDQIEATGQEIRNERLRVGDGAPSEIGNSTAAGSLLSQALSTYESIETERTFATNYYNAMLENLTATQMNAMVQPMYLEPYVRPTLAQYALYPRPTLWTLLTFIVLTILWFIGVLFFHSIRDQAS